MNEENLSGKERKESFLKKKEIWITGIIGLLIGLVIGGLLIYLLGVSNGVVAKFKGGKISEKDLYKEMRKNYPISYMLELVDDSILKNKYELTDEQKSEIEEESKSVLNMYKTYYGYTEKEFLEENGFESKEDFINYLQLDYRRNLYCMDYFKTLIEQEDIQDYYDNNVYGTINTKHILIKVSDDLTDKQALAKANEIIAKLNKGKSFDEVSEEYKDKAIIENVDFDSFTANQLANSYVEASEKLEKGTYTKEAVKTDFGYHVIYCVSKEDKPSLEEVETDIIEILSTNIESQDKYVRYKALIKLREEYNLKFNDEDLEDKYEEYCKDIKSASKE